VSTFGARQFEKQQQQQQQQHQQQLLQKIKNPEKVNAVFEDGILVFKANKCIFIYFLHLI
jgi:hypothetical protein